MTYLIEKYSFWFFMALMQLAILLTGLLCNSLGLLPEINIDPLPTATPCVETIDTGTVIKTHAEKFGQRGSWYDYYLGVDFDNQPDKTFSISQDDYLLLKENDRVKVTYGCQALDSWYKSIEKIEGER